MSMINSKMSAIKVEKRDIVILVVICSAVAICVLRWPLYYINILSGGLAMVAARLKWEKTMYITIILTVTVSILQPQRSSEQMSDYASEDVNFKWLEAEIDPGHSRVALDSVIKIGKHSSSSKAAYARSIVEKYAQIY